jgi:hypothetical protein
MQAYQTRVVEEKAALDDKAHRLSKFIGLDDRFDSLSPSEQELLREQCETMWEYSEILGKRIALFGDTAE